MKLNSLDGLRPQREDERKYIGIVALKEILSKAGFVVMKWRKTDSDAVFFPEVTGCRDRHTDQGWQANSS